ncbi:hypothetical protein C8D94_103136 [Marinirhabdus gelatinilytica]|uniref:SpoIIAA-like protein n=1 Tax=Marinirhabdus gelatinilytica TaxID=1703343 RepID=A0A370QAB6_9FLAO|nr:hypothetical protein C8D94_103136 [Marinirhabdus gelatinilytica]
MNSSKTIDLGFATFIIHEFYTVSTIAEGVTIDAQKLEQIFELFTQYYKDKPFVSIANRVHDYTLDPNLLSQEKHPSIVALAVVCENEATKGIAAFEKQFYHGTYVIFDSLDEAKEWAVTHLEQYLKNAGL